MSSSGSIPKEIKRKASGEIEITWENDVISRYDARTLRLACACAACRDEMTGKAQINPQSIPQTIFAKNIDPVGRYGIRIIWSDGHDTGIYTFDDLRVFPSH